MSVKNLIFIDPLLNNANTTCLLVSVWKRNIHGSSPNTSNSSPPLFLGRPNFKFRYGTTIWSPLAGGILSGKYNDGIIPPGSRMHNDAVAKGMTWPQYFGMKTHSLLVSRWIGPSKRQQTVESLKGLAELAQQLKCTQSQLALAWTLANSDTSTCLLGAPTPFWIEFIWLWCLGASKVAQLEDNLGALDLLKHWNPEIEEKCDKIFHNTPKTELNWRMPISKIPGRRTVALVPHAKKAKL